MHFYYFLKSYLSRVLIPFFYWLIFVEIIIISPIGQNLYREMQQILNE